MGGGDGVRRLKLEKDLEVPTRIGGRVDHTIGSPEVLHYL